MLPFFDHVDSRIKFGLLGAVLALGAPLGWKIITLCYATEPASAALFVYLTASTTAVFTSFGIALGTLHERIRGLAMRDPLTGLLNQTNFRNTAHFIVELARRHREPYALVMMDIDHFKRVNDEHNHFFGSHVLKELAKVIEATVRASDIAARFGGDEFILLLPRTTQAEAALVTERLRATVAATTFVLGADSIQITLSIGVALAEGPEQGDLDALMALADKGLYQAKNNGRNRVVISQ